VFWRYLIDVLEISNRCPGDIWSVSYGYLMGVLEIFLGVMEIFVGYLGEI